MQRDPGGVVAAVLEPLQAARAAAPCRLDRPTYPTMPHMRLSNARASGRSEPRRGSPRPSIDEALADARIPRRGASTITRTSGSVPEARTSTRPRPSSASCSRSTASQTVVGGLDRIAVAHAHVHQPLRQLLHRVARGQVPPCERLSVSSAAAVPSPAGTKPVSMMWPDCSPPSAQPRAQQLVEHVAVADVRGRHLDPGRLHRPMEAEVRHHGHGHAAAGQPAAVAQVQGREGDQLVAVDHVAVAVDGEHAVAVAVEGEAERRARRRDALGERARGGSSRSRVDVAAVGLGRDRVDVGAEPAEDLRRDAVGGAVGAVEQDARGPQRSRSAKRGSSSRM